MTDIQERPAEADFDKPTASCSALLRTWERRQHGAGRDGRQTWLLPRHGRVRAHHAKPAGRHTDTDEHYTREWLNAQAAGGYVDYDAATGRYWLPAEQAAALTDETCPAYLPGFFQSALGTMQDAHRVLDVARGGAGLGWHERTCRRARRH